jgi:hypothetical protein
METCLYLVMAEILIIQFHENGGQLQVIILMVLWSLALVIVFFKELLSMKWYGIGVGCGAANFQLNALINKLINSRLL